MRHKRKRVRAAEKKLNGLQSRAFFLVVSRVRDLRGSLVYFTSDETALYRGRIDKRSETIAFPRSNI